MHPAGLDRSRLFLEGATDHRQVDRIGQRTTVCRADLVHQPGGRGGDNRGGHLDPHAGRHRLRGRRRQGTKGAGRDNGDYAALTA
ncbi:MAG TPA: hypothetical protein DIU10_03845 [Sulfitobacter sp.]|nr:hypothetical protein [Sulfitobacter sp.]